MEAKDIRRLLILDTETQGVDIKVHKTIEVACALYDIAHAALIASFASLIRAKDNEAEHINRIPPSLLNTAPEADFVWANVTDLAQAADVIVAHRVDFDRQFVPPELAALRPWACSKYDMEWTLARDARGEHLVHLALAYEVAVYSAHRAMTDVDTLVRTFQAAQKMGHDVATMVARSMRPKGLFQALVSYEKKDDAKNAGFQWDGDKKTWSRRMFLDEAEKLPFKTKRIG